MKKICTAFLLSAMILQAQSAFDEGSWDTAEESGKTIAGLTLSGNYEFEPRIFYSTAMSGEWNLLQGLDLNLNSGSEKSAFSAQLRLDDNTNTPLLTELKATAFMGRLQLDAGRMKLIWGKGDQLHVVDYINADDYYDFIFPDYLKRRRAEDMLHASLIVGPYSMNAKLEIVVTPSFTPMQFPDSGPWAPDYLKILASAAPTLQAHDIAVVETDYSRLDDGQAAFRWTQSLGGLDYGISGYRGKSRIPSFSLSETDAQGLPHRINLINNDIRVIGLEWSTAFYGIDFKGEMSRTWTDDPKGIHYDILNPKWSLLLGMDVNLPIHHLSVNIQGLKDYAVQENSVLQAQNATNMQYFVGSLGLDPSFASINLNDYWKNDLISFRVGDSFFREKLKSEIQMVVRNDSKDGMFTFKADYALSDQLTLSALLRRFHGPDGSVFGQYDDKDFVSLRFNYVF